MTARKATKPAISFGTDGWRGIIAESFTFDTVRLVSQAIADYVRSRHAAPRGIVIGFDNRFQGETFSRLVAEVMVGNGIPVCLAPEPLPTPAISFAVHHHDMVGGVMITASHNPAEYNGLKFKTPDGASADQTVTSVFEKNLGQSPIRSVPLERADKALILDLPIELPYLNWIRTFADYRMLGLKRYNVIIDSMYGVGKRYIEKLLDGTGHNVTTIRATRNPTFHGIVPEPVPRNLEATADVVRACNGHVACATDGDADRLAALDDKGAYIITPRIAVLIAMHLQRNRGWTGSFVKTLSCSMTVDRFAAEAGMKVIETPVGFKHIVPHLLSGNALIGTEESGGLGFKNHIPERDGILGSLLFIESLIGIGFNCASEAMAFLDDHYGTLRYHRVDERASPGTRETFARSVKAKPPKELLGKRVVRIKDCDGIKFECEDDSWLLIRFSGTEPVVRFYAEASSYEDAIALTEIGREMLA